jgi:signal transduction histidine kinase
MKLWHKILLVSLGLYAFAFNLSSIFFLSRSHMQNLAQETDRAFSDQAIISERIEAGLQAGGSSALDNPGPLMQRYAAYYQSRRIELALYQISTGTVFGSLSSQDLNSGLLEIDDQVQRAAVSRKGQNNSDNSDLILVSSRLQYNNDFLLLYARDISSIYEQRRQMIQTFLAVDLLMAAVIGLAAFYLARRLTRPLEKLGQATEQIANGQYNLLVPESRDETAVLVRSFNKMSEAVKSREETLEQLASQRQQFIDNLTHEMNTPLTSIQGYATLLQQARLTEAQQQQASGTIEREAKRLRELYEKLMELLLTQKKKIDTALIQLPEFFAGISSMMKIQLENAGIRLELHFEITEVRADAALLEILLTNLIRNAIQASESGTVIVLSAGLAGAADEKDGSQVKRRNPVISVEDQGRGIEPEHLEQIFEPFYRVDRSRSRRTGGAGLGLALCQEIARQHNGKLEVRSVVGQGTRIDLILPPDEI